MAISQHLRRKLQEALGAEAAADLVSQIEEMTTLRGDLNELRHEMQLGFARIDARFEKLEARFEKVEARFDARFEKVEAMFDARFKMVEEKFQGLDPRFAATESSLGKAIEKGLREQTRFFFLAWSVLLAVIIGLYAR